MKIWLAAAASFWLAGGAPAQLLTNADIRPAAEPLRETVFGETLDDPWRWMERADRAGEVESFIRRSSAHTVAQLAALPGRNRVRDRIAAAFRAGTSYGEVQQARDLLFYRRRDPEAQLAKLVVRTADGRERVLYDPETDGTIGPAIGGFSVSPDASTVALNLIAAGDEAGSVRFLDVTTGQFLADRLEPVWGEDRAAWLDNRTIAYTRLQPRQPGVDQLENSRLHVYRLGDGAPAEALLGAGVPDAPGFLPQEFPLARTSERSDWVLATGTSARADRRIFVARRADVAAGRRNWREIGGYDDRLTDAALVGDRLYLLTSRDAPRGAVLRVDLSRSGGASEAAGVMPESEVILRQIAATSGGLYALGQIDGLSRLFFVARGEDAPVELELPMRGLVSSFSVAESRDGVVLQMQDYFTAPRWFAVDGSRVTPLGLDALSYRVAGATQRREEAVSADGTRVPLDILLPPASARPGPLPMLLSGYGGYGISSVEPYYRGGLLALLESGGALATCGTRGGGERGRDWHEAGREANKPNAHADLIACAERLVALGLTTPDRLTVMGTSAGGLLAPPAALRRPDLFGALIANVAVLNASRLAHAENGSGQFAEMGDPATASGFRALLVQDAYQLLAGARDMPDTLVTVGLNDRRVAPWMSAKFAARALDRFGDRRLVLIRTDPEAGHGVGSARQQTVEQWADIFAFVLSQAGAEGFAAPR